MHVRGFTKKLRRWAFPVFGWAAAVYLLVASGFSIPVSTANLKDLSTPFPCMDRPCGCKNAEQCWLHCCCHTLAERLAWARENGVQPPEFAVAEARAQGIDVNAVCTVKAKTCCCCCAKGAQRASQASAAKSGAAKRKVANGVVLLQALKCGGVGGDWLGIGIAVPPRTTEWNFAPNLSGWAFQTSAQLFDVAFPPPVPPPRSLTA
jgi:hypothetical protein